MRGYQLFAILILVILFSSPVHARDPDSLSSPQITNVIFCMDVDDSGNPIEPTEIFPSGTTSIMAWFEYQGVSGSPNWGYTIYQGDTPVQVENYQMWPWYEEGSAHRDFTEEDGFSDGTYLLTFKMKGEEIGSASFIIGDANPDDEGVDVEGDNEVESEIEDEDENGDVYEDEDENIPSSGSFGRIIFAEGVTEESAPIGEETVFDSEISEVYLILPYFGMADGDIWKREWILDGEEVVLTEEEWYEGTEGITYRYLHNPDGSSLSPGDYTVNLYLGDQLARSAGFSITDETEPEITGYEISDLVDPDLMKAYNILSNSDNEALRILSTLIPDEGISVGFSDDIPGTGQYRYSGPDDPGEIYISPDYWNEASWEEVAGTVAHELTHALQRSAYDGTVKCTIENEYLAFLFEFYTLQETGRTDIIYEKFGNLYAADGSFDKNMLWNAVKKVYSDCPEE
ncbi:MAG: hypothetical protein GXY48_05295 [Methanomicrobiales archaeon]|nr:hypothetical protein [Methanomicrobiales archaeon]